jgi:phosphatidylinositol N-acetylglucosaminyltransferase subunit A
MVEYHRLPEHRVQFLGAVPHSRVRSVLCSGHIFLNCSLTESFCIAIVEAASCGLQVVSTNVGGIPEVLPSPDLILLGNPNVQSMIQQLQVAIARERLYRKCPSPEDKSLQVASMDYGARLDPWEVHRRVSSMYSWRRVALETIQVYDEIELFKIRKAKQRESLSPLVCLGERLAEYNDQVGGGFSGLVIILVVSTIELWLRFVELCWPIEDIDTTVTTAP